MSSKKFRQQNLFSSAIRIIAYILLLGAFFSNSALSSSIELAWDKPDDSRVVGYNIYVGSLETGYGQQPFKVINDPLQTNCSIVGLQEGAIYVFAATSFDSMGNESIFSNELSCNVPANVFDSDSDGLQDSEEDDYGTDLNNPDTDGDGFLDGDEISRGFDPLDPDSFPDTEPINNIILQGEIVDTTLDGYPSLRKEMNLGGINYLRIWGNGDRRILMKADLDRIPDDVRIEKADLKLFCYNLYWSGSQMIEAYRMTTDWQEGTSQYYKAPDGATWFEYDFYDHNQSEEQNWNSPGGDFDGTSDYGFGPNGIVDTVFVEKGSWITFDITTLVQEWIAGDIPNFGIMLRANEKGNDIFFYSSEAAEKKPEIEIYCSPIN